jgi:rhamnulokinase
VNESGYVAIDLGASSGRVVLGNLNGAVMRLRELHRFITPLVERDGHLFWDIDLMWREIRFGIERAFASGCRIRSISVDSWAVDYVPLDAAGHALRQPYSYRDERTTGRLDTAVRLAGGADALYDRTGIQFLSFNTLPQLLADIQDEPALVRQTAMRLHIAEYFLYRLSGRMIAEATMASTTQLVDARTGEWATDLLVAVGDEPSRWPPIVKCGTQLGPLLAGLIPRGVVEAPVVVATCAHDTAAAVAAVPTTAEREWAFISSGTWSLVGAELASPVLTSQAREAGFTNEAGWDGTIRFLKNRAGMWVLEECRREWAAQGIRATNDVLFAAAGMPAPARTVNLNAPQFASRGGMLDKLRSACVDDGIPIPATPAETARLILDSIAASHASALDELDAVTGVHAEDVHVVGGGATSDMLNQLTADRCGRRVLAGPEEATVLGNLLHQARALGDLPAGVSVRDAARRSSRIREFTPRRAHVSPNISRTRTDSRVDTR